MEWFSDLSKGEWIAIAAIVVSATLAAIGGLFVLLKGLFSKKNTALAPTNEIDQSGSENTAIIIEKTTGDIAGRHILRLNNSAAKRKDLAGRIKDAGCKVNLDGVDWLHEGDFSLSEGL